MDEEYVYLIINNWKTYKYYHCLEVIYYHWFVMKYNKIQKKVYMKRRWDVVSSSKTETTFFFGLPKNGEDFANVLLILR